LAKVKINVLTTYTSPNSLALIYPLLVNRRFFSECGIIFEFHGSITPKTHDCDVIFINSKFFRTWHIEREKDLYDTLLDFKKTVQKIIWFDTTDSTGTTQFNVMPFVDGYYKSQVLKDRSLYEKDFYGNRIFTDYYKRLFDVRDDEEFGGEAKKEPALSTTLKKEDAHKLGISWNSAMNDWGIYIYNYTYTGMIARLRSHIPFGTEYKIRFINPARDRKTKISGRIGLSHAKSTVRYQRERIVNILREKFSVDTSVISRNKYLGELKNSRIGVSPFGMGEISCRDFEVIINGALLFKQDMSHLETWPPLYVDGETYITFSWDLSDFEGKLRELLKDDGKIVRISENAQRTYEYYLYDDGRMEFCNKVMDILR